MSLNPETPSLLASAPALLQAREPVSVGTAHQDTLTLFVTSTLRTQDAFCLRRTQTTWFQEEPRGATDDCHVPEATEEFSNFT